MTTPRTETATSPVTPSSSRFRMFVGIGGGNAMEWFDWNIYATFAAFFAPQFFHSGSSVSDLLKTLAVFAVGFVARPFGGFLFGRLADRRGRRPAMALSVGLAAVGSLVIGLTPTYGTIGSWGAVVLVLCRLAQGLAHGGELPSAQTYISEVAPPHRRGLWSSLIYFSGTLGIVAGTLLGAVLSSILTTPQMDSYGWRIPFLVGGVFGLFTLYMRAKMQETETFTAAAVATKDGRPRDSLVKKMWERPALLFRVIGITVGATVVYYVWAVSAPAYAISVRGVPATGALWAGVFANLVFLIALPVWGIVSDRIGRKPVLIFGSLMLIILLFPLNAIIKGQPWQLFVAMAVALVLIGSFASIGPAVYAEMFPTGIRAAGLGVPYSVAVAVFGGTAPYLQTFFADRHLPNSFNWYAIGLMAISIITVVFMPETKGRDLRDPEPTR
ncbi:MFS transporter [Amycolatopsis saalfeldensis]|uniref:MFS transporter, MHS family, alpha-ketoglutarate permease n=1 Tax=Amycolatopsis saalfeldensis TaxID=394193 RepID=A0A1H8XCL7_9PSEU|nr:MFS transporter [Amycolatopsis saalfeldensis]SEP37675.1 MFS transporter, MHS family, alpha-ketoglutarate permease [Amycolatopsis saalfeldensis]